MGLSLEAEPLGTRHYPLQRKIQCRGHLNQLDIEKSMGPSSVHPRVLKMLVDVTARLLTLKGHGNWGRLLMPGKRKYHIHLQKGQEQDPQNYRSAGLTSVAGKVVEQIFPEAISSHRKDEKELPTASMDIPKANHT